LRLGARSNTEDAEGVIDLVAEAQPPEEATMVRQVQTFVGEIDQVPPAFSAAKVTGRRAYALARQGQEVHLEPRRVRIDAIEVVAYAYPRLELEVRCGKGTYIRSLARDLGERLGCGALVETLRRTRVGPFEAATALSLDTEAATARSQLLPVSAAVAELPRFSLEGHHIARLRQGQAVPLSQTSQGVALPLDDFEAAVFDTKGVFTGVVHVDCAKHQLRPQKVLPDKPLE
jgi:tRNA pseudouridine55 synthase